MSSTQPARPAATQRHPVQIVTYALGAVFLLVGILGFIPGITTNYDELMVGGHHSTAMLLGLFQVSVLHNLVHLAFGVAGLLLGRTVTGARNFLVFGGAIYAVLWVYGLVIQFDSPLNFVPLNTVDNWLHFALAVVMLGLGLTLGRRRI
jgi:predicted Na+-dependent transporter